MIKFVVVAPPFTVSPPVCVPSPIVEDAYAVSPPLNCVSVEVALPASGNGYPAIAATFPASFSRAVRTVSEEVTVPVVDTKPVRAVPRTRAAVK